MDEISIFVSYCHDDDMWVKKGEHGLIPFLEQSLKRLGVRFWYDRALKGGDKWREEIKRHIDESRLAILLISQSFLNSEFIREHELPRIKARYDEGQLLMIPILVDHTDWESETQLGWITQLQMEPSDVTPLIALEQDRPEWRRVRKNLLVTVRRKVEAVRQTPPAAAIAQKAVEEPAAPAEAPAQPPGETPPDTVVQPVAPAVPPPIEEEAPVVTPAEREDLPAPVEAVTPALQDQQVHEPATAQAYPPAEALPTPRQPTILVDESHKERTKDPYWTEFKKRLRERGKVRVRDKKPLSKALLRGKDILVVGGPEHPWVIGRGADRWTEDEVAAVEQFVAQGGALFVIGDGLASADTVSALTAPYGISFSKDDVGDVVVGRKDISPHPVTEGVESIRLGSVWGVGGQYLQVEQPAVVLARHSGRPVLAHCSRGLGRVVALSSLAAFSNKYMEQADNAVLLDNIFRHLASPAQETAPDTDRAGLAQAEPADRPGPARRLAAPNEPNHGA